MKKYLSLSLIILIAVACRHKEQLPKGILSRDKMEKVMWDMMRASEYLNTYIFLKDTAVNKTTESEKWYQKVYEIHKISRTEFDRSYTYYKEHPALMKDIMDSLNKMQVAVAATPAAPPAPSDSAAKTITPMPDTAKASPHLIRKSDTTNLRSNMRFLLDSVRNRKKS